MTLATRTPFPYSNKFVDEDGKLTKEYMNFFQGLYDMQGASTGTVGFSGTNLTSKIPGTSVNINTDTLFIGENKVFQDSDYTNGTVLGAVSSTTADLKPVTDFGVGGDVGALKFTFNTATIPGWLRLDSNTWIGNDNSPFAVTKGETVKDLYYYLWNLGVDLQFSGEFGRGISAEEDWEADKSLLIPDFVDKALLGAGSGSGLTTRTFDETGGERLVTLEVSQLPAHTHDVPQVLTTGGSGVGYISTTTGSGTQAFGVFSGMKSTSGSESFATSGHENRQPSCLVVVHIKL